MSQPTGNTIHIGGSNSGQVAVGTNIAQTQTIGAPAAPVTDAERDELRALLAELRAAIAAAPDVPAERKAAAEERVGELEEAVTAAEPDLSTMEYVRNWFGKNLPALAGAVTSVVVHPIVGRLVEAAGDAVTTRFRERFGGAKG